MSTILDALRKAQAEGSDKPESPETEFALPEEPAAIAQSTETADPGEGGGAGGGHGFAEGPHSGPPPEKPARSYKAVGVVVLGVSLGLLLGRLLLPLATAPPDSSDLLADGVAEKHEGLLAAAGGEADEKLSPAEMRQQKRDDARREREEAKQVRREKRGENRAEAVAAADAGEDGAAPVESEAAADENVATGERDQAAAAAKVPVAGIVGPSSTGGAGERAAAGDAQAAAAAPRPESPALTAAELRAAHEAAEQPKPDGGPALLGNVVPPKPDAAPAEGLPPELAELGRDPVAAAEPAAPPPLPKPVTTPPPPSPSAPPPKALPGAPDDAPKIQLLFIQWSSNPQKRVVSVRQEGGAISVVREGEIIQGMRLAAIHPSGVEFQWRGKSFSVPVSRY